MTENRGRPASGNERHFDRLYQRIDELTARVGRLERALWLASGGLGSVASFNLITNLTNGGG